MENPRVRIQARYRHSSQFLRAVNIYPQNPNNGLPFGELGLQWLGQFRHGLRQRGGGLHAGDLRPAEEHRPHPRQFPVRPGRAGSWNTSGPSSGDPNRQRATRFCTGELFIPFLQNQLAAKFEVPSINNQSYFQHTIITLADSNFIHSLLHSFIHNSIIQSIICFLSLLIYHLYSNSFFRSIIHSFVRSFNHSSFYLSYLYSFLVFWLFSCSLLTYWLLAVHYIFTNSVEQSASSYGGFPSENVRRRKNLSGFIGHRTQLKRWPLVRSYYQHTIVTLADSNSQSYYQHTIVTLADSNNQSYYQHASITLADSNNQSYYQHTIITLADSNNQSYY